MWLLCIFSFGVLFSNLSRVYPKAPLRGACSAGTEARGTFQCSTMYFDDLHFERIDFINATEVTKAVNHRSCLRRMVSMHYSSSCPRLCSEEQPLRLSGRNAEANRPANSIPGTLSLLIRFSCGMSLTVLDTQGGENVPERSCRRGDRITDRAGFERVTRRSWSLPSFSDRGSCADVGVCQGLCDL